MLTPLSRRNPETYSDFYKNLNLNPINADLARYIDENSIKEAIKNIVLTDRGERLYQPTIGCDIRKMLFENVTPDTIILIKELVSTAISTYEPRASILGVDVFSSVDQQMITVTIVFSVINRQEPISVTITLDRVR